MLDAIHFISGGENKDKNFFKKAHRLYGERKESEILHLLKHLSINTPEVGNNVGYGGHCGSGFKQMPHINITGVDLIK